MRLQRLLRGIGMSVGIGIGLPSLLVGSFLLRAYLDEPHAAAAGGDMADHVLRGRRVLQYAYDQTNGWRVPPGGIPVPPGPLAVAAMEFEAALFEDPLNAEAELGLAECLRVRGDGLKGAEADTMRRRALALAEDVVRAARSRKDLARAWEGVARAQDGLGDHAASRTGYARLIAYQDDGVSRLRTRGLIAEQDEKLGRWQSAAEGYRMLAAVEREPGWYGDKMREMEARLRSEGERKAKRRQPFSGER